MNVAQPWQPDIFNAAPYVALHARHFPGLVRLTRPGRVFCAAQVRHGVFASPPRAPHGGFDVSEDFGIPAFEAFAAEAEQAVRKAGATRLELALPPLCHAQAAAPARLAALCRRGYIVARQELNQAIPVGPAEFQQQAAQATRKRIAKAYRGGVTAGEIPAAEHRAAYDAIADNRRKKARPMSMSWQDVHAMTSTFPDRVHMFGARQGGCMIAAALCIVVNPRVLYVHAWGEREGAEQLSPVSLLAAEAYAFARSRGFHMLDLGTSSVNGVVDDGLFAFKRSLGASASLKLWLGKTLP